MAAITDQEVKTIEDTYRSYNYGDFKTVVAEAVVEHLKPLQVRYQELVINKDYLHSILDEGQAFAQARAAKMMAKVYRKIGMI